MEKASKSRLNTIMKSFNYVGKLISTAILVLLILIGLFLVYYVICAKVVSKKAGYEPPINLYTIVSGSMEPNINVYDVVLDVKIKNPTDIKIGDVITFRSTSSISKDLIVTHRVIEIKKNGNNYEFVTKGDNNPTSDSDTAKYNNIIGKVKMRFPQLGRIQFFVASKIGWFLIVLLPAMCVIIYDVVKIIKMLDAKRTSKNINKTNETTQNNTELQEIRRLNETLEKIEHNNYENRIDDLKETLNEEIISDIKTNEYTELKQEQQIKTEEELSEPTMEIPIVKQITDSEENKE